MSENNISDVLTENSIGVSDKSLRVLRVGCLYRVSTKKQISGEGDIPMQKQACEKFAESNGWIIVKEFLEAGVSGFKVSAEDRDVLHDVKESALKKEFDILLVFMFDRLGRRDDETPFVVEWFAKQGIEVWSVKEGQQRFDSHVDKLMNYIRYWQAYGESEKTSERVRTRLRQMTEEGKFTGGVIPYGYKQIFTGMFNPKGIPIKQLVIDEREAEIVRTVFSKSIHEGYGSHRLAEYLNQMGLRTHNGAKFQANSINRMLKNRIYCGYFVSKGIVSPKQEDIVIIDEVTFGAAQEIIKQRKNRKDEKNYIAMHTKGESLLSGNVFCGHCGTRLIATKSNYKTHVIRGVVTREGRRTYICYHKSRGLNDCDGQSVYQAWKVEEIVLKIARRYIDKIKLTPKEYAIETKFAKSIKDKKQQIRNLKRKVSELDEQLAVLSIEIGKALSGKSNYSEDVLKIAIDNTRRELQESERLLVSCEKEVENENDMMLKIDEQYDKFLSWTDEFDKASIERKKMIICHMFSSIKISRGYKMEVTFNTTYQQFLEK